MSPPASAAGPRSTAILCVNAGSSSLKCARFEVPIGAGVDELSQVASVLVEGVAREHGRWSVRDADGVTTAAADGTVTDHAHALRLAMDALRSAGFDPVDAVGHRVVHGGPGLTDHAVLDDRVLAALRQAVRFAPLHLPSELAAIDDVRERHPGLPQVVCLDTAFHRTMPEVAKRLPLPRWVDDEGIRRYGFHGLSYEYVVHHVGAAALGRAVIAHLGSGASLAAIRAGASVDTTMGFTPAGGVVMATRPGDLDPGTLIHLAREHRLDADALQDLVNHESGLLGLSGRSADMEELLRHERDDPASALAVESFCSSVRKSVGALTAVLGGLDTLVFTGGIGEHAPTLRTRIAVGLAHLGVRVDDRRDEAPDDRGDGPDEGVISPPGAPVVVRVVATDENATIARHTLRLLGAG